MCKHYYGQFGIVSREISGNILPSPVLYKMWTQSCRMKVPGNLCWKLHAVKTFEGFSRIDLDMWFGLLFLFVIKTIAIKSELFQEFFKNWSRWRSGLWNPCWDKKKFSAPNGGGIVHWWSIVFKLDLWSNLTTYITKLL